MSDHPDYIRSRAGLLLDAEARAAAEHSDQIQTEATRRALTPTGIIGRVGTQAGREVEVVRTREGVVVRDPHAAMRGGVLLALDGEQAGQLVDALSDAVDPDKLNRPAHYGPIARVGEVLVERAITGTVIRDVVARHNRGTALLQMNADQTAQLRDLLARAGQ